MCLKLQNLELSYAPFYFDKVLIAKINATTFVFYIELCILFSYKLLNIVTRYGRKTPCDKWNYKQVNSCVLFEMNPKQILSKILALSCNKYKNWSTIICKIHR